jgi:iron complex outermembrane receptor protein
MSFQDDTIKINEVIISRKNPVTNQAGYKKISIDTSLLKYYSHSTLAEVLSESTGIFVKSYGMGGVATPSFRGTGANHTQIAWNSININHPMLGQSDLSLIPAGIIDDVQIYFGGASLAMSSGGIGGIINLENKPSWKKETLISISPEAGSFGQYTGLIKVKTGGSHLQTVTKAFLESSENDFRYLNNVISAEPVWETRKNSQVKQKGFIQELYYRKSKNIASARIWYQSADRNLPSSMLIPQPYSGETQSDESLRTLLNYDIFNTMTDFSLTGAFLLYNLNYKNRLASIDSRNLSETVILKAGMEKRINESMKLKLILNEELSMIKSNNYNKNRYRNTTSLTASAESNGTDRLGATLLIREIYNKNTLLFPDFSAGLQFRIVDEMEYFLKANFSRNSKIPTMNEMFWVPGGNPDLKNEYAFIYELSYEMKQRLASYVNLTYDLSLYRNNIKDMIQWHPGEYTYWTADNIQRVNSTGLETSILCEYIHNNIRARLNAGYSFTRATNQTKGSNIGFFSGNQLMYIPEHQAHASFNASYRRVYAYWVANITGRRYTTVDNTEYLPGYFLNNLSVGYKIRLKDTLADLSFSAENMFDVNYQTIAYFPLPGRSYSLKLLLQILK